MDSEERRDYLDFACPACNAKPGERCASMIDASKRRGPHPPRIELARNESTASTCKEPKK